MIGFKQFLREEESRKVQTTPVEHDELIKWIRQHAMKYANKILNHDGQLIFRGMGPVNENYLIGDSNTFRRKSANTDNFVQTFIASSNRWKGFPSREQAYICSSSLKGGYGHIYLAIPADDAKIGVCSSHDFWWSFHDSLSSWQMPDEIADIDSINTLLRFIKNNSKYDLDEDNAESLRANLRKITFTALKDIMNTHGEFGNFLAFFEDEIDRKHLNNLEEFLDVILDPVKNNIEHTTPDHLDKLDNREVWINGKTAFIKIDSNQIGSVAQLLKQLHQDLYEI